MDEKCLICNRPLSDGDVVCVSRGLNSLIEASEKRKDGLTAQFESVSPLRLHTECRKDYTRPSSIKAHTSASTQSDCFASAKTDDVPRLRSSLAAFDFKHDCLFCGKEANAQVESKKCDQYKKAICEVRTITFRDSIRRRAMERNDELAKIVLGRVDSAIDLVAAEAIYHKTCYVKFCCSSSELKSVHMPGRPVDEAKAKAFVELCELLNDDEECQYSLYQLNDIMEQFLDGQSGYSIPHLKVNLQKHYGDKITITNIPGKTSIISFCDTASKILHDKWYTDRRQDTKEERMRIVETAAAIVREDIRSAVYDCDAYPSATHQRLDESIVPESLKCFVEGVINPRNKDSTSTNRKCRSIEQALVTATRPRSFISPILLSVAVYLHRKHGSRFLIDILNNLGFSASYREVQRYEYSLILKGPPTQEPDGFLQFIFDNADFNVNTLDGHNTFHSMGGLKCITPVTGTESPTCVPRVMAPPKASVVGSFGHVDIKSYTNPMVSGLQRIIVKDLASPFQPQNVNTACLLDSLWIAGRSLNIFPRPSWNGFMQCIMQHTGTYEISQLDPLPFINMDPTNLSTIYTALLFALAECNNHGISTCFVTFDQPLFAKASEIVTASPELSDVVVRLGGFHLFMSYMGAVGQIMSGSGLEDLWSSVYAKASVVHMTTGHAYYRALRAHYLTQEALATILLQTSDHLDEKDKDVLRTTYQGLLDEDESLRDVLELDVVTQLSSLLRELCSNAKTISRTAKLWIQYFQQVNIMRLFVRAERTGDWELHLYCVKAMLPHLHAAAHSAYAKSAHLYAQQMTDLPTRMTEAEFNQFTKRGFFTIRRTDKFWCGVWSDMTIEQVLMRAIKTSGGLTRGRGISESTLAQWVLALPLCVPMCIGLEKFAGITSGTSEQHKEHKEMLPSRQSRDNHDLECFLGWLRAHPPFENRPVNALVSLSTGVVADASINCDESVEHGSSAMAHMINKSFAEVKLRRNDKVKPIAAMNNTVKIRGDEVMVNPLQLFSRIACVINSSSELASFMKYELAPKCPSLFDEVSMRRPTKAALATAIESLAPCQNTIPDDPLFVVDGGQLLHSVVWPRPATYDEICEMYVRYVSHHYHASATVVFDGYGGNPSTKSVEQKRRAAKASSADIMFTGGMHSTTTQTQFLGNGHNKALLIDGLSTHLREKGIHVKQAVSDADTLIVCTALEKAAGGDIVVVVGSDTDLLVMLVGRAPSSSNIFMLHTNTNKKPPKVFNISTIQQSMGEKRSSLLSIHGITGCDTTSALYRKGKKKAFRLIMSNDDLAYAMEVFNRQDSSHGDVALAGEKFILAMYGAARFKTLDDYRYYAYNRTVASKSVGATFNLATLAPTSAAAEKHSFRTYLQVQQWLGNDLSPAEWGWKFIGTDLIPVPTDLPPAPNKLMNLISCKCKAGCARKCGCRAAGMPCSAMCTNCMGLGCSNSPQTELEHDPRDD